MEQEIFGVFFPASGGWQKWLAQRQKTLKKGSKSWKHPLFFFEESTFDRWISDPHTLVKKQTMAAVFVFLLLPGID